MSNEYETATEAGWDAKLVDLGMYLLVQAVVWFFIAAAYGAIRGTAFRGITQLLFFAGMGYFLIGVIKMRPESAVERRRRELAKERGEEDPDVRGWMPVKVPRVSMSGELGSPLEQVLAAYPPVTWFNIEPDERITIGVKIFLSGAVMWIIAYVIEQYIVF